MITIIKTIMFLFLDIARKIRELLSNSENTFKLLLIPGLEGIRWGLGKWKAWMVFDKAVKDVPAYRSFLKQHPGAKVGLNWLDPDFSKVPLTDKESYIKKYSIEDRCLGGKIPDKGVVIDESSGTSGTPNNWVRGPIERKAVKQALQIAFHSQFGNQPVFIINAFALGPWATGMNVSMSLVDIAILKSTGPDATKIINTLKTFGPKYRYIITGYPPFLKSLVDSADIDWEKYNIMTIFGGEGMSEGMREYLSKAFKKTYGSYGASDLEINIAAESEFTIALRKLISENESLKQKLVRNTTGTLPMIFQYNPLDYYMETNEEGELVVTLCRITNTCPKVRYNIHDTGYVIRMPEILKILKSEGKDKELSKLLRADLPLLFHFGRADMSVAFYGCKITPDNIKEILYSFPDLARNISSFSLITFEDDKVNKKLVLALELAKEHKKPDNAKDIRERIFDKLKILNQDYKEASKMIPPGGEPIIEFHEFGTGPFKVDDIRLKKHYIQTR